MDSSVMLSPLWGPPDGPDLPMLGIGMQQCRLLWSDKQSTRQSCTLAV
jgi:hypothetical protein